LACKIQRPSQNYTFQGSKGESETFSKIKVFKYLNNIHSIIDIGWFMVFNATFNNIPVISWLLYSVVLVDYAYQKYELTVAIFSRS
jgi:hypothetical protein